MINILKDGIILEGNDEKLLKGISTTALAIDVNYIWYL